MQTSTCRVILTSRHATSHGHAYRPLWRPPAELTARLLTPLLPLMLPPPSPSPPNVEMGIDHIPRRVPQCQWSIDPVDATLLMLRMPTTAGWRGPNVLNSRTIWPGFNQLKRSIVRDALTERNTVAHASRRWPGTDWARRSPPPRAARPDASDARGWRGTSRGRGLRCLQRRYWSGQLLRRRLLLQLVFLRRPRRPAIPISIIVRRSPTLLRKQNMSRGDRFSRHYASDLSFGWSVYNNKSQRVMWIAS